MNLFQVHVCPSKCDFKTHGIAPIFMEKGGPYCPRCGTKMELEDASLWKRLKSVKFSRVIGQ